MRITAYILLILIILMLLFFLFYLVIGAILFKIGFSRRSYVEKILKRNIEKKLSDYKVDLCWWEKQKIKKVNIQSFDGYKLIGFYLEANSDKTVIIFHGFGESHWQMQQYCKFFHEKNFNVLAVDNRAHGESEGNCIGFGWLEKYDVISWVKFIKEKTPQNKILLFGLSMGGTAVLNASSEKELPNVEAVISDCGFSNADIEICYLLKKHKIILKLFKKHLYNFVKRIYDFDILKADSIKQVKDTKIPILYIHGDADKFVPVENAYDLYENTPTNLREIFIVKNADHIMSYPISGVIYEKKISDFLKSRTKLG